MAAFVQPFMVVCGGFVNFRLFYLKNIKFFDASKWPKLCTLALSGWVLTACSDGFQAAQNIDANILSSSSNFSCPAGEFSYQGTCQVKASGVCGPANGVPMSTPPAVKLCSAGNPTSITGGNPWIWSCNGIGGGTNASCSANLITSASGSTIPSVSQIVDGLDNIWTLSSGVVFENGSAAAYTANTILVLYYNGVIYQKNASSNWWSWSGTAWVSAADPRPPGAWPSGGIMFGANGHPEWQGSTYTNVTLSQQMALLNSMGLKSYRIDIGDTSASQQAVLTNVIATGQKYGITILPGFNISCTDYASESAAYTAGYNFAYTYAKNFQASINIWELGNECDSADGVSGDGSDISQYNQANYVLTRGVLHGMLDGIHAANPASKGIINQSGWCHYGFQQGLWNDGVHWDITGVHWYGDGGDIQQAGCENGVNVLQVLSSSFGLPIWIDEFNSNSSTGQNDGAYLVSSMAEWNTVAAKYNIQAAHIYELLDQPENSGGQSTYGVADSSGNLKTNGIAVQNYLLANPSAKSPGGN